MLTDEKKAMMLASFDVFRRPTPKMYRIQKSHDLAVHYWGLGVPLTHNSLKELWFKLYRERRAAVFNDRELSNLWRVIFTTVADGLLPLIDSPEALSIVVDALRERGKADKSEDFLRKWFDYYPGPGRVPLGGRNSMDALVASVPKVQPLAQNGFFSEGGPFRAANLLRKDENLSEGVVRVGAGFITAESRFTRYVWVERFPYYSDMIARGVHKTDDEMRAVLKFITDDSIDQGGKLRDPTMLVDFTDAMLGHFFKFPEDVPSAGIRQEIMWIFDRLLGSRKDPINASRWHPIAGKVSELFDFWEMGLELENLFDFARDAVEGGSAYDSNTTATRHWTERREFWLRYWRAGRFKKCRVYAASPTRHAELVKRFKNKYPSLISRLGVLNGRTGPSFLMFLFELRGDVVISEFSDMGKVRVGYRTSKITTTRGTIHWWDLLSKEYVKYDFTHSGDWKQQADAAIEELTHERVPR